MHRVAISLFLSFLAIYGLISCAEDTSIIGKSNEYEIHSEKWLLSWVSHGNEDQKYAAAISLMELNNKKEYYLLKEMLDNNSDSIMRSILLYSLFDICPNSHSNDMFRLINQFDNDDSKNWRFKSDEMFCGDSIDIYLNIPGEAAIRLLANGYISRKCINLLLEYTISYYPTHRLKAAKVLKMFSGIPSYNPTPQPCNINDYPESMLFSYKELSRWFETNLELQQWDPNKQIFVKRLN